MSAAARAQKGNEPPPSGPADPRRPGRRRPAVRELESGRSARSCRVGGGGLGFGCGRPAAGRLPPGHGGGGGRTRRKTRMAPGARAIPGFQAVSRPALGGGLLRSGRASSWARGTPGAPWVESVLPGRSRRPGPAAAAAASCLKLLAIFGPYPVRAHPGRRRIRRLRAGTRTERTNLPG